MLKLGARSISDCCLCFASSDGCAEEAAAAQLSGERPSSSPALAARNQQQQRPSTAQKGQALEIEGEFGASGKEVAGNPPQAVHDSRLTAHGWGRGAAERKISPGRPPIWYAAGARQFSGCDLFGA